MKLSTKAVLYSALIFPGTGLWLLKRFWRACVFMIPAGLALIYITRCYYLVMQEVQTEITQRKIYVDLFNISQLVTTLTQRVQHLIAENHFYVDFATYILIASWACGILSSYFVGRQIEMETAKKNNSAL